MDGAREQEWSMLGSTGVEATVSPKEQAASESMTLDPPSTQGNLILLQAGLREAGEVMGISQGVGNPVATLAGSLGWAEIESLIVLTWPGLRKL